MSVQEYPLHFCPNDRSARADIRSSGSSCSGRFECACVIRLRSKRPRAADTARVRRAQRGNRRTGITA